MHPAIEQMKATIDAAREVVYLACSSSTRTRRT